VVRRRVAGIDVGGTFTDLIIHESSGEGDRVRLAKIPTTAGNLADGVLAALADAGATAGDLDLIIHGTTATTNALIERKVAKVGLITTRGFRDSLELGRRTRPSAYGMTGCFEPLIARELRFEVDERMSAAGEVLTALDERGVEAAVGALLRQGCESLVIHFLHAYANPTHELKAGAIARGLWPNAYLTLGHELLAEFREYERGTTAAINAAVQPILDRYLNRLEGELEAGGFKRDLLLMNGNGGTVAARLVTREAAKTIMSGPASGVMAAAATLAAAGVAHAITYDMGGTSSDVALIRGGIPEVSAELTVDYGLPVHVPMLDVRSIGAGGGSIASINGAGMLQVGPRSAGAEPGPICYGRGGSEPTITDANLLLGRLDASALLAVPAAAPVEAVREAFASRLGKPLGLSAEAAAAAVIKLANTHMCGAIRMVSIGRGHDPRDFLLFAFGGAGPLHAVALARELGIPEVLVPARPGLGNALGCLLADLRQDLVNTLNLPLEDLDIDLVGRTLDQQRERGEAANAAEQGEIVASRVLHAADMQFRGQTHLIHVDLPEPAPSRAQLQSLFEAAYFARFQVRLPEIKPVLVNLKTSVIGVRRSFPLTALIDASARASSVAGAVIAERALYADGRWQSAQVFDRVKLPVGGRIKGPAIVQQIDATTVIEPGAAALIDAVGNLRIRVEAA
jgi:N-methylhydantoinase A